MVENDAEFIVAWKRRMGERGQGEKKEEIGEGEWEQKEEDEEQAKEEKEHRDIQRTRYSLQSHIPSDRLFPYRCHLQIVHPSLSSWVDESFGDDSYLIMQILLNNDTNWWPYMKNFGFFFTMTLCF